MLNWLEIVCHVRLAPLLQKFPLNNFRNAQHFLPNFIAVFGSGGLAQNFSPAMIDSKGALLGVAWK